MVGKNTVIALQVVLDMGLYQESFKLINDIPNFIEINAELEKQTGLRSEVEVIDKNTAVFFNKELKTVIEASIKDNQLFLYFPLKAKKNYYENSLLAVLSDFLDSPPKRPNYINKKWKDLSFLTRFLKK